MCDNEPLIGRCSSTYDLLKVVAVSGPDRYGEYVPAYPSDFPSELQRVVETLHHASSVRHSFSTKTETGGVRPYIQVARESYSMVLDPDSGQVGTMKYTGGINTRFVLFRLQSLPGYSVYLDNSPAYKNEFPPADQWEGIYPTKKCAEVLATMTNGILPKSEYYVDGLGGVSGSLVIDTTRLEPRQVSELCALLRDLYEFHNGYFVNMVNREGGGINHDGGYLARQSYTPGTVDAFSTYVRPYGGGNDHRLADHGTKLNIALRSASAIPKFYEIVSFASMANALKLCPPEKADRMRQQLFAYYMSASAPIDIRLVRGPRIIYEYDKGEAVGASSSCMTGAKSKYTELYAANPDKVALAIGSVNGTPSLRGLVWFPKGKDKVLYMDRVYPNNNSQNTKRMEGGLKKLYPEHKIVRIYDTEANKASMILDPGPNRFMPYLDSFAYAMEISTTDGKPRILIYGAGKLSGGEEWTNRQGRDTLGGDMYPFHHVSPTTWGPLMDVIQSAGENPTDYDIRVEGFTQYPEEWDKVLALASAEKLHGLPPESLTIAELDTFLSDLKDGKAPKKTKKKADTLSATHQALETAAVAYQLRRSIKVVNPGVHWDADQDTDDDEDSQCRCPECGDLYDEGTCTTLPGGDVICDTCCSDNYTYIEYLDEYHHNDECVWSETYGNSVVIGIMPDGWISGIDNAADSGDIFNEDDCVRCSITDEMILVRNLGNYPRRSIQHQPVRVFNEDLREVGWSTELHAFGPINDMFFVSEEDMETYQESLLESEEA